MAPLWLSGQGSASTVTKSLLLEQENQNSAMACCYFIITGSHQERDGKYQFSCLDKTLPLGIFMGVSQLSLSPD